jgi:hypothetical protein
MRDVFRNKFVSSVGFAIACAIIMLASPTAITKPTALPPKIEMYLSRNYPGWKQTSTAVNCIPRFRQAVVSGDFDGDGRRDYAVKFIQGGRVTFSLFSRAAPTIPVTC